jgi:hypothetical protein
MKATAEAVRYMTAPDPYAAAMAEARALMLAERPEQLDRDAAGLILDRLAKS